MVEFNGAMSAPSIVHLFGEYSTSFGEPAIAIALELRLELKVELTDFDFFIVDGYKFDEHKHKYFHAAIQELWDGPSLKFSTNSELPLVTGLGINSALSVLLTGALLELDMNKEDIPKLKEKLSSKEYLAHQAFMIENKVDPHISPLAASTVITGGTNLMYDIPAGALWSIPVQKRTWYFHKLEILKDVPLVLGFLKKPLSSKYSKLHPRPLFDTPTKHSQSHNSSIYDSIKNETLHEKVQRFVKQSGFAKDIIESMGKITRAGIQALTNGDLPEAGCLMKEQQNLMKILGIYPKVLQPLIEAAEPHSYGIAITGRNGDVMVAITAKPKLVAEKILKAGGEAVITQVSENGFTID